MKKLKQFNTLLSELKPNTIIIGILFIFSSCFQAIADILLILSLIPILTFVNGPNPVQGFESIIYSYWENTLGILGVSGIWLVAGLTAFLAAIVKIISYYLGLKFALSATTNIADKVFKSTVYKPFNIFVNESSASVQADITYIDLLENQIFKNFSKLINSLISLSIISAAIIAIDGKSFIVISSILASIYLIISYYSRNVAYKLGARKAVQREGIFKLVNEIFNNIKSIILLDLRRMKLETLSRKERKYRKACLWLTLLSIQPRFLIEGISLLIVCLWGSWLNYTSGYSQAILSVGTLVFAFKRLIPDMQIVYVSYSQFKANQYILKIINNKLKDTNREDLIFLNQSQDNFIKLDNINEIKLSLSNITYKTYSENSEKTILKPTSLSIKSGQSLLIMGKSGSGKSTLLNIISGLQEQSGGKIKAEINSIKTNTLYSKRWRRLVSYTPQDIELVAGTIKDNIIYSNYKIDHSLLSEACHVAGIPIDEDLNGFCLSSEIGENSPLISGGQRQRVGIARAIYNRRPIMIYDESTSALDEKAERELILKTRSTYRNGIFIMVSHRKSLTNMFNSILEIQSLN